MEIKDYRVEIKVKNNRIFSLMQQHGISSQSELSRKAGVSLTSVTKILSMKVSPLKKDSDFCVTVKKIAKFFDVLPDEMFNEQQLSSPVKNNTGVIEVSYEQMKNLLPPKIEQDCIEQVEKEEDKESLKKALAILTPRESKILKEKYFNGCTYDEIGKMFDITQERVRQIQERAFRKIRASFRRGEVTFNQFELSEKDNA
jgi:DNA-directed RNA polymerase specialized sigma subunit